MPSINMIAVRRAEKKRIERMVYITLLVIAGEMVLSLGVLGIMSVRVHAANGSIQQLDTKMTKLQPTVMRIQRYESEVKDLKPRLELLGDSRNQTLLWYAILHDLAKSMPEQTWLTNVATNYVVTPAAADGSTKASSSTTVNLSGTTASQKLVGDTMLGLNQCPEFDKVDLTFTQESTGNAKGLNFQIAAQVDPNTPKKGGDSKNASN